MATARLSIPSPTNPRPAQVETIQALQAWIEHLPRAQPAAALTEITSVLGAMNRASVNLAVRDAAVRRLGPILDDLLPVVSRSYRNAVIPLAPDTRRSADQVLLVLREMAHACKSIVLNAGKHGEFPREGLLNAIYGAIHYSSCLAKEHYLLYEPVPADIWGEINLLFRFSLGKKLHFATVKSEIAKGDEIKNAYLRLSLLAATNPYRMMRGEAEKIFNLSWAWCQHCEILAPPADWVPKDEIAVDLVSDTPPSHVGPDWQFSDIANVRLLEVASLKASIERQVKAAEGDAERPSKAPLARRRERNMLMRVLHGWNSWLHRTAERKLEACDIAVAIGMKDCHNLYVKQHGYHFEKRPKDSLADFSLEDLELVPIDEHSHRLPSAAKASKRTYGVSTFRIDDPLHDIWDDKHRRPVIEDEDDYEPAFYVLQQMDVSCTGYRLAFNVGSDFRIQVGDLICLRRKSESNGEWKLGAVRWKRLEHDYGGALGVRVLADTAQPIFAIAIEGPGKSGDETRGLLIPQASPDTAPVLLLHSAIYDVGTILQVKVGTDKLRVRLEAMQDSSEAYSSYSFTRL